MRVSRMVGLRVRQKSRWLSGSIVEWESLSSHGTFINNAKSLGHESFHGQYYSGKWELRVCKGWVESIQGSRNGTTASAIPLDIFVLRDVQYKMWKTAFDNR